MYCQKFVLLLIAFVFMLSGCVVRTYKITRDRPDQDLTRGNQGYLAGQSPAVDTNRKTTREIPVVEVEVRSPIKFEHKKPVNKTTSQEQAITEQKKEETTQNPETVNRGYISGGQTDETQEKKLEKYTVVEGDTLQKISKKFYGITKRWPEIYQANKSNLKSPNAIYPGQVLDIPVEKLKETKENLK
jgi:nucleoid-associated protein YgaU